MDILAAIARSIENAQSGQAPDEQPWLMRVNATSILQKAVSCHLRASASSAVEHVSWRSYGRLERLTHERQPARIVYRAVVCMEVHNDS